MAWLIWTESDPEMIKAKGVWGIQRERMTERIWLMLFSFSILLRREGDGRGGQAEHRAARQVGVWGDLGRGWGVWAHRIAPTHTPIKSIRIVRDSKKTGNHCKKWSFFYQLLNTECTPRSSLSSVVPVPCLSTPFSLSFSFFSFLPLSLSPPLPLSHWLTAFESDALAPRPGEEAAFSKPSWTHF